MSPLSELQERNSVPPELTAAATTSSGNDEAKSKLENFENGKRLGDISGMPLDLAI